MSGGFLRDAVKLLRKSDLYTWYDVRKELSINPKESEKVDHQQDGSNPRTQVAVYSQGAFGPMVANICEDIFTGSQVRFIVLECTSGFHRADTSARAVVAALNAVTLDGCRRFNAQHFQMQHLTKHDHLCQQYESAWAWHDGPWAVHETDPNFAYKAVVQRASAFASYTTIENYVQDVIKRLEEACCIASVPYPLIDLRIMHRKTQDAFEVKHRQPFAVIFQAVFLFSMNVHTVLRLTGAASFR